MYRVFLTGYMGAGKTTVGKDLADKMHLSFIDLDIFIEERYHKTVSQLFAEYGEDKFREIERRMLHEVSEFEDVIISTGGGTPCFFDNMSFMNETGTTVYLKVTVEELAARLELCRHTRPVLKNRTGEELLSFIKESLDERAPFYEQSQIVYNADTMMTVEEIKKISDDLMKMLITEVSQA